MCSGTEEDSLGFGVQAGTRELRVPFHTPAEAYDVSHNLAAIRYALAHEDVRARYHMLSQETSTEPRRAVSCII